MCVDHILRVRSCHWTLGCLHPVSVVISVAVNTSIQVPAHVPAFQFFGVSTPKWNAGSYGNSIFNFFEKWPYWFPQHLCPFTFPPAVHRVTIYLHPPQHLLFCGLLFLFFSLIVAIPVSMTKTVLLSADSLLLELKLSLLTFSLPLYSFLRGWSKIVIKN